MRREIKSASKLDCPAPVNLSLRAVQRCVWVVALCISSIVHAETYYVSPTGKDSNPGTEAAPFRTINQALGVIGTAPESGADVVVEVAGGTYNEALIYNLPSGSSWD